MSVNQYRIWHSILKFIKWIISFIAFFIGRGLIYILIRLTEGFLLPSESG